MTKKNKLYKITYCSKSGFLAHIPSTDAYTVIVKAKDANEAINKVNKLYVNSPGVHTFFYEEI